MLNATLVGRQNITDTLVFLRVRPDDGVVTFEPGQYLALGLPALALRSPDLPPEEQPPQDQGLIKRTYSIASSPSQAEYYEFYVAILPQGQLTARLAALQEGDRLFVGRKPVGAFTLAPVPQGADVICFATGTGLAPFISMVSTSGILEMYNSFTIAHGVRYPTDFAYLDLIKSLERQSPQFKFLPIVSRASDNWQGARGYVQDFIKTGVLAPDPAKHHIMLCGNPGMIDALEADLSQRGFTLHSKKSPGNLHLEKYW